MQSNSYDVIVIGVGSMGSAACYWLARRGYRVLGIEQFTIPHESGAHTGQSRIIRKAYFEHPDYVPLLERAYDNWRELEATTGNTLYHETGLLYQGPPQGELLKGVRTAASLYQVPLEELSVAESAKRFASFRIPQHFESVFEPQAGFVTPEKAILTLTTEAALRRANIHSGERVQGWLKKGDEITVTTDKQVYHSKKLVITAGPWANKLFDNIPTTLVVTRQTLAWVAPPKTEAFLLGSFPCWLLEDETRGMYYGFPILPPEEFEGPSALKIAHHFPGEVTDPDKVDRSIHPADEEDLRFALENYLPEAGTEFVLWKTCLYANSADEHFILDHLPGTDGAVSIACGFSGHGFKFAPVIGEILADLAMEGKTSLPAGFLTLDRFASRAS